MVDVKPVVVLVPQPQPVERIFSPEALAALLASCDGPVAVYFALPPAIAAKACEALAAHEFGDEVRAMLELADAIHRDNIRMLQAGRGSRLDEESLASADVGLEIGGDELHSDRSVE